MVKISGRAQTPPYVPPSYWTTINVPNEWVQQIHSKIESLIKKIDAPLRKSSPPWAKDLEVFSRRLLRFPETLYSLSLIRQSSQTRIDCIRALERLKMLPEPVFRRLAAWDRALSSFEKALKKLGPKIQAGVECAGRKIRPTQIGALAYKLFCNGLPDKDRCRVQVFEELARGDHVDKQILKLIENAGVTKTGLFLADEDLVLRAYHSCLAGLSPDKAADFSLEKAARLAYPKFRKLCPRQDRVPSLDTFTEYTVGKHSRYPGVRDFLESKNIRCEAPVVINRKLLYQVSRSCLSAMTKRQRKMENAATVIPKIYEIYCSSLPQGSPKPKWSSFYWIENREPYRSFFAKLWGKYEIRKQAYAFTKPALLRRAALVVYNTLTEEEAQVFFLPDVIWRMYDEYFDLLPSGSGMPSFDYIRQQIVTKNKYPGILQLFAEKGIRKRSSKTS